MSEFRAVSMKPEEAQIVEAVLKELHKAQLKFNPINSAHEGYGVIREELEELSDAFQPLVKNLDRTLNDMDRTVNEQLWAGVKADDMQKVVDEATHVAAMAIRFLLDVPVCKGTRWKKRQAAAPVVENAGDEARLAEKERAVEDALRDRETIEKMRADLVSYEKRHAEDQQLIGKQKDEIALLQKQAASAPSSEALETLARIHDLACMALQSPVDRRQNDRVRVDPGKASEVTVVMGGQRFSNLDDALRHFLFRR